MTESNEPRSELDAIDGVAAIAGTDSVIGSVAAGLIAAGLELKKDLGLRIDAIPNTVVLQRDRFKRVCVTRGQHRKRYCRKWYYSVALVRAWLIPATALRFR